MTTLFANYADTFTLDINNVTITTGNGSTGNEINLDGEYMVNIAGTITYHASATAPAVLNILEEIDDVPTFMDEGDEPKGIQLPFAAGATKKFSYVIRATDVVTFKPQIFNNSGQDLTAVTTRTKLGKLQTGA